MRLATGFYRTDAVAREVARRLIDSDPLLF